MADNKILLTLDGIRHRLKGARGSISQDEMASKIGVSRQTVYNYEAGKTPITMEYMVALSENTHKSLYWLIFGNEKPEQLEVMQNSKEIAEAYRRLADLLESK